VAPAVAVLALAGAALWLAQRRAAAPNSVSATRFTDEIGNLPLAGQVKLLRVLETGRFERVGSSQTRQVNVRVVSATNADLHAMVRAGSFRKDLLYRLNALERTALLAGVEREAGAKALIEPAHLGLGSGGAGPVAPGAVPSDGALRPGRAAGRLRESGRVSLNARAMVALCLATLAALIGRLPAAHAARPAGQRASLRAAPCGAPRPPGALRRQAQGPSISARVSRTAACHIASTAASPSSSCHAPPKLPSPASARAASGGSTA
jgi:hypothetical protein